MTTNWREKLINKSFMPSGISLDYADADRRIMTEDALAILHEARRAAFEEAAYLVEGRSRTECSCKTCVMHQKMPEQIRALAAKEGET